MNDFKFTKAIMNNEPATTTTTFMKMNDVDRIQRIHDNMESIYKKPVEKIKTVKQEENDIFKSRINALNNIKKD